MTFSERFAAWADRVPYKFTKYFVHVDVMDSSVMMHLRSDKHQASIHIQDQSDTLTGHFSITDLTEQLPTISKVTVDVAGFMWMFSYFFGQLGINVHGCEPFLPSIADLKAAIDDVLGDSSAKIRSSLLTHNSPHETTKWMHHHACAKAFADQLVGESVDTLRAMLCYLNQHGNYPIDSWEMTCR